MTDPTTRTHREDLQRVTRREEREAWLLLGGGFVLAVVLVVLVSFL